MFGILVIASVNVSDRSCNIGEYLDYSSCKCRKKIDPLLEECTENINETKLIKVTAENKNNDRCRSHLIYYIRCYLSYSL